ncbi:transmembrane protein, putative (macronuclear) [Tetrahymena thermophila SB210]|uniref:Transmembrane protein, putative n=1 Tax=Tetrahymena thermophila (strain SB210) TaxID=312017 RepID=Q23YH8_TETTS|nr:transmembrane protein, putative [Tetrahymena thermophila SB210]EAS01594.1 transmembrane protein, putative [Tetrahymena thermophila SB210]|eukprot:XP_001021839.1 transmembrane protein, putative [Tetrahymena thermophila SB210]
MKTALILISIISLVSILTVNSLNKHQSLRQNGADCSKTILQIGYEEILVTNTCQQNMTFKYSVSAKYQNQIQTINVQTDCLKQDETESYRLDFPSDFQIFSQSLGEQSEC